MAGVEGSGYRYDAQSLSAGIPRNLTAQQSKDRLISEFCKASGISTSNISVDDKAANNATGHVTAGKGEGSQRLYPDEISSANTPQAKLLGSLFSDYATGSELGQKYMTPDDLVRFLTDTNGGMQEPARDASGNIIPKKVDLGVIGNLIAKIKAKVGSDLSAIGGLKGLGSDIGAGMGATVVHESQSRTGVNKTTGDKVY